MAEKLPAGQVVSKERMFDISSDFTGEGLRAHFGIPQDVSIRQIESEGIIERTHEVLWHVAGNNAAQRLRNGDYGNAIARAPSELLAAIYSPRKNVSISPWCK